MNKTQTWTVQPLHTEGLKYHQKRWMISKRNHLDCIIPLLSPSPSHLHDESPVGMGFHATVDTQVASAAFGNHETKSKEKSIRGETPKSTVVLNNRQQEAPQNQPARRLQIWVWHHDDGTLRQSTSFRLQPVLICVPWKHIP